MAELIAHDKAGERILESPLAAAEARLHEEGIAGKVYLFKNNTDSAGNSYGCHENYLVSRHGEFQRSCRRADPVRQPPDPMRGRQGPRYAQGAVYCISQRAEHIWEGVSSPTTRSRPITTPGTSPTPTPSATAACT